MRKNIDNWNKKEEERTDAKIQRKKTICDFGWRCDAFCAWLRQFYKNDDRLFAKHEYDVIFNPKYFIFFINFSI